MLLRLLQIILTIGLIVFISVKAQDFLHQVEWSLIPSVWPHIIVSALLFTLGYFALAEHWLLVAREIIPNMTSRQRLAFFASQPYKYLPTSFFTLSFRALYAKKIGMSVKDSSKAQLIENGNIVSGALIIGGLAWIGLYSIAYLLLAMGIIILILVVLWKNHHINLHIRGTDAHLHIRCWIKAFLLCLLAWIAVGFGFFVLATGLQDEVSVFSSVAASGFAFGAGILAIFAPGGIGVREVIFSSFGFIASTVIVWRCITFLIDLILGAISIILIERSHTRSS